MALDARTGKVAWDTTVADYRRGYTFTGGPMVAKGKVIAGISGCTNPDTAGGCFIVALDANTGARLWRTQTIAQPGSPGDESWNGLMANSCGRAKQPTRPCSRASILKPERSLSTRA